jgi:RNA polymerase sigma-70 factor (ECF subfamily)
LLVQEHATEVYRMAAAIVGEADAADVTQETFVAAWQQLPSLRKPDAFRAWLRRICVNRSRNWLRGRGRRGTPASLDISKVVAEDRRPDFRGAVEARAVLEPAFERLTPDQRALLALHYGMGLSIADAAEAVGVPVGTAKSRLNAGLTALRTGIEASDTAVEEAATS